MRRRIDAERYTGDERHIDPHAGFQRPQLFETLAPLQRRWRQRDKPLQRRSAESIKADVVIERPLAGRRRRAREIKRSQAVRAYRRTDHLDDIWIAALVRFV